MTLSQINPYVRFARCQERKFITKERIAPDHRIFFVEEGSAVFYLDGQAYPAEKGDIFYWHSGIRYRVAQSEDAVISGCNFDFFRTDSTVLLPVFPMVADQFSGEVLEKTDFVDSQLFDRFFRIRSTYAIRSKLHELYEEYESRQIFYEQRCSALLKDVLMLCLRFLSGNQAEASAKITQEILAYIKQHYPEDLTNAHFAKVFHYHPNYISQLIKEQTGLPLHRYIRNFRIHTALDLLQSTDLTVAQAAEQVGIPDIHQFSKAFKQVIGISPSALRK
jgi:AraC-like DNA-binding protein